MVSGEMTQSDDDLRLATRARGPDRWLGWLILLAGGLLVAGWLLPIMTVERFFFLSEEVSILQAAYELLDSGHFGLFAVVVGFSVVFPAVKLLAALYLWQTPGIGTARTQRTLLWIDRFGKWSMLDVFVAALVVVAVEISLIAEVEVHAGIYVFAIAVILSMIAVRRLLHLAHQGVE
jgi:paraquat-inducible protein A